MTSAADFGPVLPERASEDDPASWGDQAEDPDARLLDELPPHHLG